jgi:hypothetical protein
MMKATNGMPFDKETDDNGADDLFEWPSDDEISDYLAGLTPFRDLPDDGKSERRMLEESGRSLGLRVVDGVPPGGAILVVAGPSDYEAFASALVSTLVEQGYAVKLACLWLSGSGMLMGEMADRSIEKSSRIVIARSILCDPARILPLLTWPLNRARQADCRVACHRSALETMVEVVEFPMSEGRRPVEVVEHAPIELGRNHRIDDREQEKRLFALEECLDRGDDPSHTPAFVDAWFRSAPDADRPVPADGDNP